MKVTGIVAEYNPFHNGHEYHIKKTKELTNNSAILSIMSSSFVQRGEPAALDKFTRAKMAINGGANLVLELPIIYSVETAELFAFGAINILDKLNIVDYLSFGSEANNINNLNSLGEFLAFENHEYKLELEKYLFKGLSFPRARVEALSKFFSEDIVKLLKEPNNILAVEYIKALNRLNSNIEPITIKRKGSYHSKNLDEFSNSTGIRESISKTNSIRDIKSHMNIENFNLLNNFYKSYKTINSIDKYDLILRYLLVSEAENFLNIPIGINGLSQRILNISEEENNILNIIEKSISKIHTRTRVKRLLIKLLLKHFEDTNKITPPNYIRVLAADKKGLELLSEINKNSNINILTNFKNYRSFSKTDREFLNLEKYATDIYFLTLNGQKNMDFYTSPYIEK